MTFLLKELGEKTEFTLIHGGWSTEMISKANKKASDIRNTMNQGWEKIVHEGLKKAVEG